MTKPSQFCFHGLLLIHLRICQTTTSALADTDYCPPSISDVCANALVLCDSQFAVGNISFVRIRCRQTHHSQNKTTEVSCLLPKDGVCREMVSCSNPAQPCDLGCSSHFRCPANSSLCVKKSTHCLPGGCVESPNGGVQCARNHEECVVPRIFVEDGIQDCDHGEDECSANDGIACFACDRGSKRVVPASKVCDDVDDCGDLSDECYCSDNSSCLQKK